MACLACHGSTRVVGVTSPLGTICLGCAQQGWTLTTKGLVRHAQVARWLTMAATLLAERKRLESKLRAVNSRISQLQTEYAWPEIEEIELPIVQRKEESSP